MTHTQIAISLVILALILMLIICVWTKTFFPLELLGAILEVLGEILGVLATAM